MKSILKKIYRTYRDSEFRWRFISNLRPSAEYFFKRPKLEGEAARVLRDLNRDGIAVTNVEKLLKDLSVWEELKTTARLLAAEQAVQIQEARSEADELKQKKGFIYELLKNRRSGAGGVFARFVLQNQIKGIADIYMGLTTELKFYDVWHTFKITGDPRRSQLWHQDPEDRYIFRVFAYLADVDESSGPLTYVAGSHPKGKKIKPEYFLEPGHGARRSTDEQMRKAAPEAKWVQALGPSGTLIFADTRGYHKGGLVRGQERIMFNAMFTSPACKISSYH